MGFKIKRNGTHKAKLVICSYSQIYGVNISEHYSPVVHNITYHILVLLMLVYDCDTKNVDVKTAFLYGDFEFPKSKNK